MTNKYLKEALEFQIDIGVDEIFSSNPKELLTSKAQNEKPSDAGTNKTTYEQAERTKQNNVMQENPKPDFTNSDAATPDNTAKKAAKPTINGNEQWVKLARDLADKASNLDELKKAVTEFDGLSIKKLAKNCVFAEGNPESELMLVGEAPGANEDETGIPFCGVSGRLLDKILFHAGYERAKNCYITNTIFWRPPGNRKPLPEELEICRPFVEKHIALINPKVIVLVGGTAAFSILGVKDSVTRIRGKNYKYNNQYLEKEVDCFAIFHPSYLLRQPSQKKNAWFDILKIKKYIENS